MSEESYLYAVTTGWKSGKPHEIEIWYVTHDGCFYVVAEMQEKTHWVQNIQHNPTAKIFVGTRTERQALPDAAWRQASARIIDPDAEPELTAQIRALMNQKYGWSTGTIAELKPESK